MRFLVLALAMACAAPLPALARAPDTVSTEQESTAAPSLGIISSDLSPLEQMTPAQRDAFVASLDEDEAAALLHEWSMWARPKQLAPPGDWNQWLVMAGRGWGKTRVGAEFVRSEAEAGRARRIALVGATAADVRDVMIEGESGLLAVTPDAWMPKYEPSKRRLSWRRGPSAGAIAMCYSAEEPKRLRGPQHDLAWADELAAWQYPETWDQLQFGLRLGSHPRSVVTTTPRPIPLVRALLADPKTYPTRGSTYENAANLAANFKAALLSKYEGTRLGRQELHAEVLDDTPGALWTQALLDRLRVRKAPELRRTVVAIDPSVAGDGGGDECGIVTAGVGPCSCKGTVEEHAFVLADDTAHLSPDGWARVAIGAYRDHDADRIVAEANNGGALVETNLRTVDRNVPITLVHAAKGKRARAEPVAALYEQGKVHHVGALAKLEDELTTWDARVGAPSPNRMDAVVWALTNLVIDGGQRFSLI